MLLRYNKENKSVINLDVIFGLPIYEQDHPRVNYKVKSARSQVKMIGLGTYLLAVFPSKSVLIKICNRYLSPKRFSPICTCR